MKNVYKVQSIEDNFLFKNVERLQNGLFLNYCNPLISLYLLNKNDDNEHLEHLAMLAHMKVYDGSISDNEGNVIDKEHVIKTIIEELYLSAKKSLENDNENGLFITNVVKQIFNTLLNKEKTPVDIMSVEDLMAKLYQDSEEKEQVLNGK